MIVTLALSSEMEKSFQPEISHLLKTAWSGRALVYWIKPYHAAIFGKEQPKPFAKMWSSLSGHHSCGGGHISHQIGFSQSSYWASKDGCGGHVGYFGLQGRKATKKLCLDHIS